MPDAEAHYLSESPKQPYISGIMNHLTPQKRRLSNRSKPKDTNMYMVTPEFSTKAI